jgi:hypothetical protein
MSTWLIQRECITCGTECYSDEGYAEPRCELCWISHTGAVMAANRIRFRVKPPKAENIVGLKRRGRYIKGEYVYWDDVTR